MRRKAFILMLVAVMSLGICFSTIVGRTPQDAVPASTDTTVPPEQTSPVIRIGDPEVTTSQLSFACNTSAVIEPALENTDEIKALEWATDNESVVTVDCGGKIDSLKQGKAVVTAKSNKYLFEYEITVTKEEPSPYDGYSTCIIANTDKLLKNLENIYEKNPYFIKVNRQENCVTVYTYDESGEYTVPVRAMICSCGTDYGTVTGDFSIYFQTEWNALFGDVYGHYVSGFYGNYLFHSVPYYYDSADSLEVEEYNKLGEAASMGCVRMQTADVKWIYENCPIETPVVVYDDDNPGPLGKPEAIRITDMDCGWDPTDDSDENPYKNKAPKIKAADATLKKGESFDVLASVSATDTCGNDITDKIVVTSNVITDKKGTYSVTYNVEDAMHRTARADIMVTVE